MEKKQAKKTVGFRLEQSEVETLEKIKEKYRMNKSEIIETLIKKYAKEEYGTF